MNRLSQTALGSPPACLLITPASTQPKSEPENLCQSGGFPLESDDYRAAKVKGAPGDKIYFHDDSKASCPADRSCRLKAYVIPGDQVIVAHASGKFACSLFQPLKSPETDRLDRNRPARMGGHQATAGRTRVVRRMAPLRQCHSHLEGENAWRAEDQRRGLLGLGRSCEYRRHRRRRQALRRQTEFQRRAGRRRLARWRCGWSASIWLSATTTIAAATTCRFQASIRRERSGRC